MPMGAGQTKGASSHGWGTPLHSFWCCYGSAVESFSKVADSIFFYRCHRLHTQSCSLLWLEGMYTAWIGHVGDACVTSKHSLLDMQH